MKRIICKDEEHAQQVIDAYNKAMTKAKVFYNIALTTNRNGKIVVVIG